MADLQVAHLVAENLTYQCPVSNVYRLDGGTLDGSHVMVTVKDPAALAAIFADMNSITMPSHVDPGVDVFLCNEDASVIYDADGDPTNGMTAYASTDPHAFKVVALPVTVTSHAEALNILGYELVEEE